MEKAGADRIQLCPFPGRDTSFRFELKNLSDQAKNVVVQLRAVPGAKPNRPIPRDLLLREDVEVLAAADAQLPPKGAATPVAFKRDAPKKDAKPQPKPLTWACAIYDKDDTASSQPKWIYPIDFLPVAPKTYLQCTPDSAYDPDRGEIKMKLKLRRMDRDGEMNSNLPPLSEKNPISVVWNTDGVVGLDVGKGIGTHRSNA